MPKRTPPFYYTLWNIIVGIALLLLFIAMLKTVKMLPDPPEILDITVLFTEIASALIGAVVITAIRFFWGLKTRLDALEESTKSLTEELKHFREYLKLSTRLSRLEAKMGKD